jgi:hypothetical protein
MDTLTPSAVSAQLRELAANADKYSLIGCIADLIEHAMIQLPRRPSAYLDVAQAIVAAARDWARGVNEHMAVAKILPENKSYSAAWYCYLAAHQLADACELREEMVVDCLTGAAEYVRDAIFVARGRGEKGDIAWDKEALWQIARLADLHKEEHLPPLGPRLRNSLLTARLSLAL